MIALANLLVACAVPGRNDRACCLALSPPRETCSLSWRFEFARLADRHHGDCDTPRACLFNDYGVCATTCAPLIGNDTLTPECRAEVCEFAGCPSETCYGYACVLEASPPVVDVAVAAYGSIPGDAVRVVVGEDVYLWAKRYGCGVVPGTACPCAEHRKAQGGVEIIACAMSTISLRAPFVFSFTAIYATVVIPAVAYAFNLHDSLNRPHHNSACDSPQP